VSIQIQYFSMEGGWNNEAPPLATKAGELIDCYNYECLSAGGYRRIYGYQLHDGQAIPSQEVPGVGDVLGVHVYKGTVYAMRSDGTVARLYKATAAGWLEVDNTVTWSDSGRFRFTSHNFTGQDADEKFYIVNGVDKAYQCDGAALVEITTGTGFDNPSLVVGYKLHLFLAIESSLVWSQIGDPLGYSATSGAGEAALGDTIKSVSTSSGALIIGCEDSTHALYGSSSADFTLEKLGSQGAYFDTMRSVAGQVVAQDRQGLLSLQATQNFGNFAWSALSVKIAEYMRSFPSNAVCVVNQTSNQYRLFSGSEGIYFTFQGNQLAGISRVRFDHPVICLGRGIGADNAEINVFGSSDGRVYKMDSGFTFDGSPITSYLVTSFHTYGGPTVNKRFRLIQPDIRVEGADYAEIGVRATADYGNGFRSRGVAGDLRPFPNALWDYSRWGEFRYDSAYHNDGKVRVSLTGKNMAVFLSDDGSSESVHTVYGVTVHYSPRRLLR